MRFMIAPAQKVDVVGRDQPNSQISGDLRQTTIALALLFHPVIVKFDKEIFRSENVAVGCRGFFGLIKAVRLDGGIDLAGESTTEPNQPR